VTALRGLDARLRLARLYLCTDARERQGDLAEFLAAVLAGGVDVVQIRQPGLRPAARRAALAVARQAASRHQAVVGVAAPAGPDDDAGADLVHLDQGDGPAAAVRARLGAQTLIGRSTHDARQADGALAEDDLDYLWVGPVRAPAAPVGEPAVGLDLVRHAATVAPVFAMASTPWFAAGGITTASLDAVLAAGARRVCVGSALTAAPDPQQAAAELAGAVRAAWRADPGAERYTFAAAASSGRS
jgi:thiamine-phosphate pyrophosphorylase